MAAWKRGSPAGAMSPPTSRQTSLPYYLRAMDRFPEVFEWVHNRGWREAAKLKKMHPSAKPAFEALSRHMQIHEVTFIRYNPARRLTEGAIHCRG